MKRRGLVVLGVFAGVLPTVVAAQSRTSATPPGITFSQPAPPPTAPSAPGPGRPGSGRPGGGPPFFPVGAPPSHPLPTPFAGTVPNPFIRPQSPDDVFRATRRTYAPRYGRLSALRGSYYGGYYAGGYVDPNYYPYGGPVQNDAVEVRDGRLSLFVTPLAAQVHIDGFYVGTVADFQDRGLWLEPGPRRIELRADGYETVTFDVRITEDETVNYRRELARQAARSEPPRPPAPPKTFYVIPGCYAGDSRPSADSLPTGCSTKNLKTIPPVTSRLTPAAGQAGRASGTRPAPQSLFKF